MLPPEMREQLPGMAEAAERLRDGCGVDAWSIAGVTLDTAHEFQGDKLQRAIMLRLHDFINARWRRWSTPLERAMADSAVS
eukprot:9496272-Karenia_brevis.AAC.1